MSINYEKHQRDYTILATSVVMEGFCESKMTDFFHYTTTPLYLSVKGGALYHYISDADKWGRMKNWLAHNSVEDLIKHDQEMDQRLTEYYSFIEEPHIDKIVTLEKIHQFMKDFLGLIVLVSDLLLYEDCPDGFDELGLEIRKKYEPVHREQMEIQMQLLKEIEAELGLEKRGILENMTSAEFKIFTKTRQIPADLEKRKEFFFVSYGSTGEKFFTPEEAEIKLMEIDKKSSSTLEELKGQVAFAGVAQGRVRIVRLVEDAQHLEIGEILVASMTDPRYVPAMKRAAGFITDEGGITCHAAIVAREMQKPCIIGTKFATSILKTGDYVKLDARYNKISLIK